MKGEDWANKSIKACDSIVKVMCTENSCGWSIVWHNFGLWADKNNIVCEKCGAKAKWIPATNRQVCRLGGLNVSEQGISAHYDKHGVFRKTDIL